MTALTILSTPIRQFDGLYSLNDLHKASGGENKHRPNYFLSNEQTKALIDEIQIAGIPAISAKPKQGTYGCPEVIIAYAAWISAAFHLKVIRVFLDQHKEVSPEKATPKGALTPGEYAELLDKRGKIIVDRNDYDAGQFISKEQEGILSNLMAIRFPDGRDRPYGWSRFNRHFVVSSYKNLPASKFAEACCYIPSMPDKEVKTLPAPAIKPPVWTKPDPEGVKGAVRNIETTKRLVVELKIWANTLPREIGDPLWHALDELNDLLLRGWSEVDEALSRIDMGLFYLHRWQGRNGRIGNVG